MTMFIGFGRRSNRDAKREGDKKGSCLYSCRARSVTQFRFPLGGGGQGILFRLDGALARPLDPSALSGVEFNVLCKLRRYVVRSVDGVYRTFIHASHAIDAFLRVNDQLTFQLIEAGHRAYHDAVGELALHTFIGNDMRHKLFFFQVDGAYEGKIRVVSKHSTFGAPACLFVIETPS